MLTGPEVNERLTEQIEELKRRAHQISVDIKVYCGKDSESISKADEVCAAITRLEWTLGREDKCIDPPPVTAVQSGCSG